MSKINTALNEYRKYGLKYVDVLVKGPGSAESDGAGAFSRWQILLP